MTERSTGFDSLIPELTLWNDGNGIDIDSWLCCVGTFDHAIAYGQLFWPDFVLHDGCVLCAGFSLESFQGFMEQTGGNRGAVEAVMNHRHLCDLFPNTKSDPSDEVLLFLANKLKEMWSLKLARDFPEREITVSVANEEVQGEMDIRITFFQNGEQGNAG